MFEVEITVKSKKTGEVFTTVRHLDDEDDVYEDIDCEFIREGLDTLNK